MPTVNQEPDARVVILCARLLPKAETAKPQLITVEVTPQKALKA